MPLFIGLIFSVLVALLWLVWSLLVLFAAAVFFIWPLALLLVGVLVWRAQVRLWSRTMVAPGATPSRESATASAEPPRNSAFDEYREATLRRLDEEASKFREFLERMRRSRDKQEFDRYMAERRARPSRAVAGSVPAIR
jgi:biopolymer transport protein ExbB/TolQ